MRKREGRALQVSNERCQHREVCEDGMNVGEVSLEVVRWFEAKAVVWGQPR
jgi:hypothetical protein